MRYVHSDHLGSTNVVTDEEGTVAQVLDYYPFGDPRVKSGTDVSQREYIGETYDESSGLNYLNARYYEGNTGRFISQDPSFLALGDEKKTQEMTKMKLELVLMDPQSLNSYSYARNNPIKNIDPDGKWFKEVLTGQQSWSSFVGEVGQATQYMGSGWQFGMDHPYLPAIVGTLPLAGYGAAAGLTALSTAYLEGAGTACLALCGKAAEVAQNVASKWPGPGAGQQVIDGIKYSEHALARMAPVGTSWVDATGKIIEGRGVPPSVVQNAIQLGTKTPSYDSAVVHVFENVRVISNATGNFIRSVMKTGN